MRFTFQRTVVCLYGLTCCFAETAIVQTGLTMVANQPAHGASITLSDGAGATGAASSVSTHIGINPGNASSVATDEQHTTLLSTYDGSNFGSASYTASAQFGQSLLVFSAVAGCTLSSGCGPDTSGKLGSAEAIFTGGINATVDTLTFTGLPGQAGLAEFQYSLVGYIGGSATAVGNNYPNQIASLSLFLDTVQEDIEFQTQRPSPPYYSASTVGLSDGSTVSVSFTPDPTLGGIEDFTVSGIEVIPITGGQLSLSTDLVGGADVFGSPNGSRFSSGSAYGQFNIFGLKTYSSDGSTLLSDVSVTSASGFDYTGAGSVPEPGTYGMSLIGLAALAWKTRNVWRFGRTRQK